MLDSYTRMFNVGSTCLAPVGEVSTKDSVLKFWKYKKWKEEETLLNCQLKLGWKQTMALFTMQQIYAEWQGRIRWFTMYLAQS